MRGKNYLPENYIKIGKSCFIFADEVLQFVKNLGSYPVAKIEK